MTVKDGSNSGGRTRHYRDFPVWQKAMSLTMNVYRETENIPNNEKYGLQSQMRRAAVSVPSNIAEGHGRLDDGHFRQFLATSRGSVFELETQLELASGLHFVNASKVVDLIEQCEEVARMLNGLIAVMETKETAPRQ